MDCRLLADTGQRVSERASVRMVADHVVDSDKGTSAARARGACGLSVTDRVPIEHGGRKPSRDEERPQRRRL